MTLLMMRINDYIVGKLKPRDEVKYYPEYWAGMKLAYPHVTPQHPKFSRSVVVGTKRLKLVSERESITNKAQTTSESFLKEAKLEHSETMKPKTFS